MTTKIQTYLSYPGGQPIKIGKTISLQQAIKITQDFNLSCPSDGGCIKYGTAILEYATDRKHNTGTLTFNLSYDVFMRFDCDKCLGPCVTIPLSAKRKMDLCRAHLCNGLCKDARISKYVGAELFPQRYNKTR